MNHTKSFTIIAILALVTSYSVGCNDTGSPTTIQNDTLAAGTPRIDKKGIDQVWVPAGSFLMGTTESDAQQVIAQGASAWVVNELNSEKPQHTVNLLKGYWIDKFEITNAAFQAFVNDSGYQKLEFWSEDGKAWLLTQSSILPPKNRKTLWRTIHGRILPGTKRKHMHAGAADVYRRKPNGNTQPAGLIRLFIPGEYIR